MTLVSRRTVIEDAKDPRRWLALFVLTLGLLVVTLGNGAVNIALPVLASEYEATTADLQWVVTAYGLALAGLLFTGGALGDRFGRKHAFLLGLLIFLAGSVVAAFSPGLHTLILARAIMGCSAALILPAALAIVVHTFTGAERATAIAIWTSALGFGGSIAPVATGWVLAHFPHGVIFVVGTPLTLVALVGGALWVRQSSDPDRAPMDLLGCLLSTFGIVACVFAIIEAPREGWLSPTALGAFFGGIGVLVLFGWWERKRREPMIDMETFRSPVARIGVLGTAFCFLAMQGIMFLTSQHLQSVAGYSPLLAGAVNIPWGIAVVVASMLSGRAVRRWGSARVVGAAAGLIAVAAGAVALTLGPEEPLWVLTLAMTFFHIGFGFAVAPLTAAIMAGVPARRAGGGGALNSFARESGGALGVAIMGTVAAAVYSVRASNAGGGLDGRTEESLRTSLGEAIAALRDAPGSESARNAFQAVGQAFDFGFSVSLGIVVVGGVWLALAAVRHLPGRTLPLLPVNANDVAAMADPELVLDSRDPRQ